MFHDEVGGRSVQSRAHHYEGYVSPGVEEPNDHCALHDEQPRGRYDGVQLNNGKLED